jgi:hypothetical protein
LVVRPHVRREPPLHLDRRTRGMVGAAEGHEESVPLRVDLGPTRIGDGFAHQPSMVVEQPAVPVRAKVVQQPRGAFDIREQERDRPARALRHMRERSASPSRPTSCPDLSRA